VREPVGYGFRSVENGSFEYLAFGVISNFEIIGEASGKMDDALGKLADTLEANLEFKSKITAALVYPAVILTVMIGIGLL